ncbi:MAG: hypothetical protein AAGF77_10415 [Bacteroidota bacterium]
MKKLCYLTLVLVMSFASCEKEDSNESVISADSNDELSVEAIASKMNAKLPAAEIEAVLKAYRSLTYEEFKEYINVFHANMMNKGADKTRAKLTKEMMNEVNDAIYELYGKSYASVDMKLGSEVYASIVALDKYDTININKSINTSDKNASCPNGNYTFTREIGWTNLSNSSEYKFPDETIDFEYKGGYNFSVSNSEYTCNLLFSSINYSTVYTASRLQALTTNAQSVLGFKSFYADANYIVNPSAKLDAKEELVIPGLARLDIGVSTEILGFIYPGGAWNATTKDVNDFAQQVKLLTKLRQYQ